jgi:hypothetical protein
MLTEKEERSDSEDIDGIARCVRLSSQESRSKIQNPQPFTFGESRVLRRSGRLT